MVSFLRSGIKCRDRRPRRSAKRNEHFFVSILIFCIPNQTTIYFSRETDSRGRLSLQVRSRSGTPHPSTPLPPSPQGEGLSRCFATPMVRSPRRGDSRIARKETKKRVLREAPLQYNHMRIGTKRFHSAFAVKLFWRAKIVKFEVIPVGASPHPTGD